MNYAGFHSTLCAGMAYLDPGSGSIFLQLLFSSLLGVGLFLLSKIKWIRNIFRKENNEVEEDTIEDDVFDE